MANPEEVQVQCREIITQFMDKHAKNAHGKIQRAVKRFALAAAGGILASRYEITGWEEDEVLWAIESCLAAHLKAKGDYGCHEEKQILSAVKSFIEKHLTSRFAKEKSEFDDKIYSQAGFVKDVGEGQMICIFPEVFKAELCEGEPGFVSEVLADKGWLLRDSENSPMKSVRIRKFNGGVPTRYYCLDAKKVFAEDL